jgi:hypothetical protein
MHGYKVVLTKIALNFVSSVVSSGGAKMGRFVITREEGNN